MTTVIDGDSIIYICHWDAVFKTFVKPKDLIFESINKMISSIIIETKCKEYHGFLGVGRGFRKKEFLDYKSNRKPIEIPYINECKEFMKEEWGFELLTEFEPDDAVSILKHRYPEYTIAAIDKDILNNIEGRHYNYKTREWVSTNKTNAERHFWSQVITGDTADGIKGLPGAGEKAWLKIMDEYYVTRRKFHEIVLDKYIHHYGEYEGVKNFYKNYILLKMLVEQPEFVPQPTKVDYNKLVI